MRNTRNKHKDGKRKLTGVFLPQIPLMDANKASWERRRQTAKYAKYTKNKKTTAATFATEAKESAENTKPKNL